MSQRLRRAATALTASSIVVAGSIAGFATAAVGTSPPTPEPGDGPVATCSPGAPMAESSAPSPTSGTAELPAWQTIELTDVDGGIFALADCVGTPVLVELFATWCPKCRAQLGDTNEAAGVLGDEALVVAVSTETTLSPDQVARYRDENGFTSIRFAVLTDEHLAAFVEAFGNSAANVPATPKVVIDATGRAGDLTTGPESAEEIVAQLTAAPDDTPPTTA